MSKLTFFVIIFEALEASHFRAVGYDITQGENGNLKVSRTLAWRRSFAGYGKVIGCTQEDVTAQKVSNNGETGDFSEMCNYQTGGSCGSLVSNYIVTDVESSLSAINNYCYGYREVSFRKPTRPYIITWISCCWMELTTDRGVRIPGGTYGFKVQINEIDNNTPKVKIPPIWKILAGCPAQTLALSPIDLDGNVVKCRFATGFEAMGAVRGENFNSISLNETSCVLTYDGTVDLSTDGVKPVAVMVEDFDTEGVVLSSVPVQFLAAVWSPTNANFNHRHLAQYGPGNPFVYPPFFNHVDDADHVDRRRRQVDIPFYCDRVPELISPSPSGGLIIPVPAAGVVVKLRAASENGAITRFQYNSPIGMICSLVNENGEVECSFTPGTEQLGQAHIFCFIADDVAGMSTERRCVVLNVGSTLLTAPPVSVHPDVTEIFSMINHLIPQMNGKFSDYGCTGAGNLDSSSKTIGHPVDRIDKSINVRKNCIQCAIKAYGESYRPYRYLKDTNSCGEIKYF